MGGFFQRDTRNFCTLCVTNPVIHHPLIALLQHLLIQPTIRVFYKSLLLGLARFKIV